MKMLKMELSAIIRPAIPTGPRERDGTAVGSGVVLAAMVFTAGKPQLLVSPIRIGGVFQVPKRTAALHYRDLDEIVLRGWRRGRPFERPRVPWIISRRLSLAQRTDDIENENQQACGL